MTVMSIPHQDVIHSVVNIILIILWIIFVKHYSSKISTADFYNSLRAEAIANNETRLPQINVSERYGKDSLCNKSVCIRKCCPEGQSLIYSDHNEVISCIKTNKTLKFRELPFLNSVDTEELLKNDSFGYVFGFPCPSIIFRKRVRNSYNLSSTGKLHDDEDRKFQNKRYCIDKLIKDDDSSIAAFTWHPNSTFYNRSCLYLSLVFLFITFLVCSILKELRNTTFGLCLMSHTASLYLAYFMITLSLAPNYFKAVIYEYLYEDSWYIQLFHVQVRVIRSLYFIFYYAGFLWINMICFDIWKTFRQMAPMHSGAIEWKRFLIYSLLSWFTPLLFLINHIYIYGIDLPKFQNCLIFSKHFKKCRLFLAPLGMSTLVNMFFFGHTAYIIISTWRQASPACAGRRQRQYNQNNYEKLSVCVKLFTIMGIPYILEFPYLYLKKYFEDKFWYLPDITRSLQGLLVLQLFVLNRRTIRLLYQKYRLVKWPKMFDLLPAVVKKKSSVAPEHQIASSIELQDNTRINTHIT